jgi:hypothetical protein
VLVPLAAIVLGVAVVNMLFLTAVCVIVVEPLFPAEASVALTVQVPTVAEAEYVTVALPLESVMTVAEDPPFSLPHAAPLDVKLTESLGTGPPPAPLTAAVTMDLAGVTLSAGMLVGLAVTVTVLAVGLVCVMVVDPPVALELSVAVMVQKPAALAALYV